MNSNTTLFRPKELTLLNMSLFLLGFLGILFSPGAYAVNKCTDANGKVSYSDLPCPVSAKSEAKVHTFTPVENLQEDPTPQCFNKLAYKVEYAPLRKKMKLGTEGSEISALADSTFPTQNEKELIGLWANERERCINNGEAWRVKYLPPSLRVILSDTHSRFMSLSADLYASKITYGEYSKRRQSLSAEFKSKVAAESSKFDK